jgi:hypothetical protein
MALHAVYSVNDANIACKSGFQSPVSSKVIDVKAGDKVGVNWGHIIGGAQSANDADNPIAASHKGPVLFYMYVPFPMHIPVICLSNASEVAGEPYNSGLTFSRAKVDNAASASTSGQKWFKVYQDGLDGSGNWGVDRMIQNGGWVDFTMPTCIAVSPSFPCSLFPLLSPDILHSNTSLAWPIPPPRRNYRPSLCFQISRRAILRKSMFTMKGLMLTQN